MHHAGTDMSISDDTGRRLIEHLRVEQIKLFQPIDTAGLWARLIYRWDGEKCVSALQVGINPDVHARPVLPTIFEDHAVEEVDYDGAGGIRAGGQIG